MTGLRSSAPLQPSSFAKNAVGRVRSAPVAVCQAVQIAHTSTSRPMLWITCSGMDNKGTVIQLSTQLEAV